MQAWSIEHSRYSPPPPPPPPNPPPPKPPPVRVVRFSPDGHWVVSGGDDGAIKLWDLTAGKLLYDFSTHDGPVTSIEFHPGEFILATTARDRVVKLWDLETFSEIGELVWWWYRPWSQPSF